MKMIKRITSVLIACTVLAGSMFFPVLQKPVIAAPEADVTSCVDSVVQYLKTVAPAPAFGSIGGEWIIVGIARSGRSVPENYYADYAADVVKFTKDNNGVLDRTKYTEYSRVILAFTAIGYDVTDIGGYNFPYYLADYRFVLRQGINGPIWALIALDSANYMIPDRTDVAILSTREMFIEYILDKEITDSTGVTGGWSLTGSVADPDITFMAIQGLAKYYNTDPRVKAAVERALSVMSDKQASDGGFTSLLGGASSESASQAIVGLCALGIDPQKDERFIKNGKTLIDNLLTYIRTDANGIGFSHLSSQTIPDGMATEQGLYALVAYERLLSGKTYIYDMTDVIDDEKPDPGDAVDQGKINNVISLIEAIGTVTLESKSAIDSARDAYNGLNAAEKKLVANYSVLAAAILKYDELYEESIGPEKATGSTKSLSSQDANTKYVIDEATKSVMARIEQLDVILKNGKVTVLSCKNMIAEIARDYNLLSHDQKLFVSNAGVLETYLEDLKAFIHHDTDTGIRVSNLPGYVELHVTKLEKEQDYRDFKQAVNANKLLDVFEITLIDLTTSQPYHITEPIVLILPIPDYQKHDGIVLAHYSDDGKLTYIKTEINADGQAHANVISFSKFAFVGYKGESPLTLNESANTRTGNMRWLYIAVIAAAAILTVSAVIMKKRPDKPSEKDAVI